MSYQDFTATSEPSAPRRPRRYIGTTGVAERYARSVRTVQRWLVVPPPDFPKPVKVYGRWRWDVEHLDAYDDAILQAGR